MSRWTDRDDIDHPSQNQNQGGFEHSQSRADGSPRDARRSPEWGSRSTSTRGFSRERTDVRYCRRRYQWSELEREVLAEIGRFRIMDEQDVLRAFYGGAEGAFHRDLENLSKQSLVARRSIPIGNNRHTLRVIVLTPQGKRLLRARHVSAERQALMRASSRHGKHPMMPPSTECMRPSAPILSLKVARSGG
jgi:hypothetical protein